MAFNEAQKRAIRHTDGPALYLQDPAQVRLRSLPTGSVI